MTYKISLRGSCLSGGFETKKDAKDYLRDIKKLATIEEDDGT